MSSSPRVFCNHSRHTLVINNLQAPIDVFTFDGVEGLSQPCLYSIEFTSATQAHLANAGLQNHPGQASDGEYAEPLSHTDHRDRYEALLNPLSDQEGKTP